MTQGTEVRLAIAHARAKFAGRDVTAAHRAVEAALARHPDPLLALVAGRLSLQVGDLVRARELLWRAAADGAVAGDALVSLAPILEAGQVRRFLGAAHDLPNGGRSRADIAYASGLAAFRGRMWRAAFAHLTPLAPAYEASRAALVACGAAMVDDAVSRGQASEAMTALLEYAAALPMQTAASVGLRLAALLVRLGEPGAASWLLLALRQAGVETKELRFAAALASPKGESLVELASAVGGSTAEQELLATTARAARHVLAKEFDLAETLLSPVPAGTPAALLRDLCAARQRGQTSSLQALEGRPEWRDFITYCRDESPQLHASLTAGLQRIPPEPRAAYMIVRGEREAAAQVLQSLQLERPGDLRLSHNRALLALARAELSRGADAISAWNECIAQFGMILGNSSYLEQWVGKRLAVYTDRPEEASSRATALAQSIESHVRDRLLRCRDRAQSERGRADYGRFDVLLVDFRRELMAAKAMHSVGLEWRGTRIQAGPLAVKSLGLQDAVRQLFRGLNDSAEDRRELRSAFSALGRPLARASLGMHIDAEGDLRRLARAATQMQIAPPGFGVENPGYGGSSQGWRDYILDLRALLVQELLAAFKLRLLHAVAQPGEEQAVEFAIREALGAAREHGCTAEVCPEADSLLVAFAEQRGSSGELQDVTQAVTALETGHRAGMGERVRGSLATWLNRRALLRRETGDIEESLAEIEAALSLNPYVPTIVQSFVDVLLSLARENVEQANLALARQQAERAHTAISDLSERSGFDPALQARRQEVEQLLVSIARQDSGSSDSSPTIVLERVRAMLHSQRFEPAIVLLEKVAQRYPEDARTADFLAWAYLKRAEQLFPEDPTAARTLYERADELANAASEKWPYYSPLQRTQSEVEQQRSLFEIA
jgi:tetratricopeptide (TPR) repeat protein